MLDRLSPRPGARQRRKRVARGAGASGHKTAGRGTKGQGKRSAGRETSLGFEGGQMPLARRLPKRGFTNIHRKPVSTVNVRDLRRFEDGATVDPATLLACGLVRGAETVKLLGEGEPGARLTVRVHRASASAIRKIEAAGGSVEIIA
jgi:large subunit ribosomal protein L15